MQPGHRIAQYEIREPVGAGGMGEVFAARDTNLDRDVAVKVLPREMADNPGRLARLEREAKAIAALSHPNILAVYDFGTDGDGNAYVVTELLLGETLREQLAQGPLPPRKVTEYGRQIARGLAAAHDQGIVHRDLKPENLFLMRDGRVKILDFGLATAAAETVGSEGDPGATIDLASDTKLTAPGAVLGTVDYMSPEQVRGQPTDARSDLFSLGTVLHELLGGERPFHRETAAETMTAILREDPPELAAGGEIPPALVAIIRRCLEKRPGERFHSAHDLAFSLEALSGSTVSTGTAAALTDVGVARRGPGLVITALLVACALVGGAAATWFLRPAPEAAPVMQFQTLSLRRGTVTNARFSSGDRTAIYSAAWAGERPGLFQASDDSRTSVPLDFGECELLSVSSTGALAVSVDRRPTLGWESWGTLAIAEPGGGVPRPILENVGLADWSPDGRELAVTHQVDGTVRLEYPVGTVIYEAPGWISGLRVHPDGDRVLIADNPLRGDNSAQPKIIGRDGTVQEIDAFCSWGVLWAPDGESIYIATGRAVRRIRPGHEPELVGEAPSSLHLLDVAPSGRMLMSSNAVRRETIGRGPGAPDEINLSWQDWSTPSTISDDGRWVLIEEGNNFTRDGYAVFLRETGGAVPLLVGYGSVAALAPDGSAAALVQRPFQDDQSLSLVPTGAGQTRTVETGGLRISNHAGRWVRDGEGEALVVPARHGDGGLRIYRIPLTGSGAPEALTPEDFRIAPNGHCISPDGRHLVVRPSAGAPVGFDGDGAGPYPLEGVLPTDLPLRVTRGGRVVFVQEGRAVPARILRVDTRTGERSAIAELAPGDPAGVSMIDRVFVSEDGSAYVYSIRRMLSRLHLVEGVR